MSSPFPRTTRSLSADGGRITSAVTASSLVLLAGWTTWVILARLPLYETSDRARVEVLGSAHPVSPTVSGRVTRHALHLGRTVRQGEVLIELEAEPQRWAVSETQARRKRLLAEAEAIRAQIRAARAAGAAQHERDAEALEEARAQAREAEFTARLAEEEASRAKAMFLAQVISVAERDRTRGEARVKRAAASTRVQAVERLAAAYRLERRESEERFARLEQALAQAEGDEQMAAATLERARSELRAHRILAPASGWIGEVLPLAAGAVVSPGDRLAVIVPDQEVRAVAEFPDQAMGWIRAGQRARLQLRGYPWVQYGWVEAIVSEVGRDAAEGRFRVMMRIIRHDPGIPLAHGLAGSAEIEVGQTTPLKLLLRTLGQRVESGADRDQP
jgi:multidrug resistance efflux pump